MMVMAQVARLMMATKRSAHARAGAWVANVGFSVMAATCACGAGAAAATADGWVGAPGASPSPNPSTPHRPADLPRRNLLVEVRQVDAAGQQGHEAGLRRGEIVVHSSGRVSGQMTGGWSTHTRTESGSQIQQLWVLNGQRAMLRVGQSVPLQWWQAVVVPAATGASGVAPAGYAVQAVPTTVWSEAGQTLWVLPTWRRGYAEATIEVQAERRRPLDHGDARASAETGLAAGLAGGPGANESTTVLTTVQVPLGTWVTLASSTTREEDDRTRSGATWSTRSAQSTGQALLQVRVSLPDGRE